jgi:hydroxymethylglutaryl-CoA reductase (NADPH)
MLGSVQAGSLGANAHHANVLAAIYIATGQDPAQVVEGSTGITTCELIGEKLYISVTIPALEVGTVGGGTRVETQQECLSIMGCLGPHKARKFASITAGAVLAGELSLLGALSAGELATAHAKRRAV